MIVKSKPCPGCQRTKTFDLPEGQIKKYMEGELIQKAFPQLTPEERESLVTGYCDSCWNKLFKDQD